MERKKAAMHPPSLLPPLVLLLISASFCQAEKKGPYTPLQSSRRSLSSLLISKLPATNDKDQKVIRRELAGSCPANCPDQSTCQLLSGAPTCKCPFPTYSRLLNNKCTIRPLRHWGYLDALNDARIAVGASQLNWNSTLAQQAQAWANSLAVNQKCGLALNANGQNVANMFQASSFQNFQAMNLWVAQGGQYKLSPFSNRGAGGCKTGKWSDCAAYTQVVWKTSTQVGCGMSRCSRSRAKVWVCNFFPPGNIPGLFPY